MCLNYWCLLALRVNAFVPMYIQAPAFLDHAVSGVILRSLTTEDLRDELGVKPLRHRRALIAAIDQLNSEETAGTPHAGQVTGTCSSLPEFGRMLTHMSNVRTVHSWQRLAVQQLILAEGVVRLALVELKEEKDVLYRFVLAACSAFCVACVLFAVYGGWRFLKVTSILDSDERESSKYVGAASHFPCRVEEEQLETGAARRDLHDGRGLGSCAGAFGGCARVEACMALL